MRVIASFALFLMIFPEVAIADGLDALIELGQGQAQIQNAYAQETKAYGRVKRGVDEGIVKKGTAKKEIRDRYGEPVADFHDSISDKDEWLYKPAKTDHFAGGERIRIYFDKDGKVDEITVFGQGQEKDK